MSHVQQKQLSLLGHPSSLWFYWSSCCSSFNVEGDTELCQWQTLFPQIIPIVYDHHPN
jgi:hypothetical protein